MNPMPRTVDPEAPDASVRATDRAVTSTRWPLGSEPTISCPVDRFTKKVPATTLLADVTCSCGTMSKKTCSGRPAAGKFGSIAAAGAHVAHNGECQATLHLPAESWKPVTTVDPLSHTCECGYACTVM